MKSLCAWNKITGVQEKAKAVPGHVQSILICFLVRKKKKEGWRGDRTERNSAKHTEELCLNATCCSFHRKKCFYHVLSCEAALYITDGVKDAVRLHQPQVVTCRKASTINWINCSMHFLLTPAKRLTADNGVGALRRSLKMAVWGGVVLFVFISASSRNTCIVQLPNTCADLSLSNHAKWQEREILKSQVSQRY